MSSPVVRPVRQVRRTGITGRTNWWAYAMIAPAFLGLAALYLWPFVSTFIKSFMDLPVFGPGEFNGVDNYTKLIGDDSFWRALGNTSLYTAIVLLGLPLAIVFAALIQQAVRGRTVYRVWRAGRNASTDGAAARPRRIRILGVRAGRSLRRPA